jgi:hypothetical protein
MEFFITYILRPPITVFSSDTDRPISTMPKQHQYSCRSVLSKDAANRQVYGVVYMSEYGALAK